MNFIKFTKVFCFAFVLMMLHNVTNAQQATYDFSTSAADCDVTPNQYCLNVQLLSTDGADLVLGGATLLFTFDDSVLGNPVIDIDDAFDTGFYFGAGTATGNTINISSNWLFAGTPFSLTAAAVPFASVCFDILDDTGNPDFVINTGVGNTGVLTDLGGIAINTFEPLPTDVSCPAVDPCDGVTVSGTSTTTAATCNGNSDGAIDLTPAGGTAPYTFAWSGGAAAVEDPSGLAADTYNVTITDANNCTGTASAIVGEPAAVAVTASYDCTLGLAVNATGGDGAFTFTVNGNVVTGGSVLTDGVGYVVVAADGNGCTGNSTSFDVDCTVVDPCDGVTISGTATVTDATCNGNSDGAIDLTPAGGTAPYTFAWSGGAAAVEDPSGLAADTYNVTITDANNCTGIASAIVGEPAALVIAATHDCTTGLDASAIGGTTPYIFSAANGTVLADGANIITVTDANGCTDDITLNVNCTATSTGALYSFGSSIDCDVDPDQFCLEVSLSSADATDLVVGGATLLYTFDDSVLGNPVIDIDDAFDTGFYFGAGTVTGNTINISSNWLFAGTTLSLTGAAIPFATICYDIIDDTANPNFVINTGAGNTGVLSDLGTVYDSNFGALPTDVSCPTVDPCDGVTISGTATVTDATCNGNADGVIDLTPAGGTAPYTFAWSGGAAAEEDPSGLAADTYNVTITDANNCTGTASATVGQPDAIGVNAAYDCVNGLAISVAGGDGTFTFTVNGTVVNVGDLLADGVGYTVVATDGNGCTANSTPFDVDCVVVDPCDGVTIVANETVTDVTCSGDSDGQITLAPAGGTAPYTFAWSDGLPAVDTQTGLGSTDYNVTITDAAGCTATASIDVDSPAPLIVTATYDCETGLDVTVFGGVGVVEVTDQNGDPVTDGTILADGTYTFTATDINNCTSGPANLTVDCPVDPCDGVTLSLSIVQSGPACVGDGASVALIGFGGVEPYTYVWEDGADPNNLVAGTYDYTITDANGCTLTGAYTVEDPDELVIAATHDCTTGLTVSATGGNDPYTFSDTNGTILADGLNTITVTDFNGCTDDITLNIDCFVDPCDGVTIEIAGTVTDAACNGDADGGIDISVTGGMMPYTYAWSNETDGEDLANVNAGPYSVTVTDANGCENTTNFIVGEPDALSASATYDCETGLALSITGGTVPYTTTSGGVAVADGDLLPEGINVINITDGNGCSATASVTVSCVVVDPCDDVSIDITGTITNATCNGDTDGGVDISVSGGMMPYTYAWSNSTNDEDLAGVGSDAYSVTVTDANGCTGTVSFNVGEPDVIVVTATYDCTTGLAVSATGGDGSFTFSNNTGDLLADGTYTVTATDGNGCVGASAEFVVACDVPDPCDDLDGGFITTAGGATSASFCNGDGNADFVTFVTSSLNENYVFLVTSGGAILTDVSGNTINFEDFASGTYQIYGVAFIGALQGLDGNISGVTATECAEVSGNFITVVNNEGPDASVTDGAPVCNDAAEGNTTANLSALVTGDAGGTWSGTGVSGATFDGAGLAEGCYDLTYTVTDTDCADVSAVATICVEDCIGDPENNPPVAVDDEVTIVSGSPEVNINVIDANGDFDPDGDDLTLISVDNINPAAGVTATFDANGDVTIVIDGVIGTITFDYTIADGNGGTDVGTVTIIVSDCIADAGVIDDNIAFACSDETEISLPTIGFNDTPGYEQVVILVDEAGNLVAVGDSQSAPSPGSAEYTAYAVNFAVDNAPDFTIGQSFAAFSTQTACFDISAGIETIVLNPVEVCTDVFCDPIVGGGFFINVYVTGGFPEYAGVGGYDWNFPGSIPYISDLNADADCDNDVDNIPDTFYESAGFLSFGPLPDGLPCFFIDIPSDGFLCSTGSILVCPPDSCPIICSPVPGALNGPAIACAGETVDVLANGLEIDGEQNEVATYVLHTEPSIADGDVLATVSLNSMDDLTETVSFELPDGAATNTTYYVTVVVGNAEGIDANGIPDLDDEVCTASSNTIEVAYLDEISIALEAVCNDIDEEYSVVVFIGGGFPAYDPSTVYDVMGSFIGSVDLDTVNLDSEFISSFIIGPISAGTEYNVFVSDLVGCAADTSGIETCKPTPIELVRFDGEVLAEGNLLNWVTASEIDNDFFTLYRSVDGNNFTPIATIDGAGTSINANNYQWLDVQAPNGLSYYRLDQTDFDGTTTSSEVITLRRNNANFGVVSVVPVPAAEFVEVTFNATIDGPVEYTVHDVAGRITENRQIEVNNGLNVINLNLSEYAAGVYFISINNGAQVITNKFIKE